MFISTNYPITPRHIFMAVVEYRNHNDLISAGTYEPFEQAVHECSARGGVLFNVLRCEPERVSYDVVYITPDKTIHRKHGITYEEICPILSKQQRGRCVIHNIQAKTLY